MPRLWQLEESSPLLEVDEICSLNQAGLAWYIKQTSAEYRLQIMQNYFKHPLCHYKLH